MRKDLNIALDAAKQLDARLPLTALVDQFYGMCKFWAVDAGIRPVCQTAQVDIAEQFSARLAR